MLWIVGKIDRNDYRKWEFQGIYDHQQKAVSKCSDWRYFVGPVVVNRDVPIATTSWPGSYYPNREVVKDAALES